MRRRLRFPAIVWPRVPPINLNLAAFSVGLALFAVGLGLAWPPAGLIGAGAVLMAIALFGDKAA